MTEVSMSPGRFLTPSQSQPSDEFRSRAEPLPEGLSFPQGGTVHVQTPNGHSQSVRLRPGEVFFPAGSLTKR